MTKRQIEKIKKKIRSLRARLSAEKRKHGWYDDSWGTRYVIAELYIQIQDFKGALRYYNWFSKEFKDDIGFPHFNLFWALTFYENKMIQEATKKVYKTAFSNTYLIELLCDNNPEQINKSELNAAEFLDYAKQIVKDCKESLTPEFTEWLCEVNEIDEFSKNMIHFISLQKLIKDEPVGEQRKNLLKICREFEAKLTDE